MANYPHQALRAHCQALRATLDAAEAAASV
jgi:hypothetical protein